MRFLSGLFRFRRDSSVVYMSCVRLSSSGRLVVGVRSLRVTPEGERLLPPKIRHG